MNATGTLERNAVECRTWLEVAAVVLAMSPHPLRVRDIVEKAAAAGLTPRSTTRTPEQSLRRDLLAAIRKGDHRVAACTTPGLFVAGSVPPAPLPAQNWLEAAVVVLSRSAEPMRVRQIAERAQAWGVSPTSTSRTPHQSLRRDLLAAIRAGDPRVGLGPAAGLFTAGHAATRELGPAQARPRHKVFLPTAALAHAIAARGGWSAAGALRPGLDSSAQADAREEVRLTRAYARACDSGHVSLYDADTIAVRRLGVHPAAVWGDAWWDACEQLDPS